MNLILNQSDMQTVVLDTNWFTNAIHWINVLPLPLAILIYSILVILLSYFFLYVTNSIIVRTLTYE